MLVPSYKRLQNLIDPSIMLLVIDNSLDHKAVVKLCNSCSFSYDGIRTKSLPTKKLIIDLVEEFYENDESAKIITKALEKTNSKVLKTFKNQSLKEIKDFIKGSRASFSEEGVGKVLFALAFDERQGVNDLIGGVVDDLDTMVEALVDMPYPVDKGKIGPVGCETTHGAGGEKSGIVPIPSSAPLRSTERGRHRDGEVKDLRSRLERLTEENSDLNERIKQLLEERKVLKGTISDIQRQVQMAQKANRALEEEKLRLEKQLEKKEQQEGAFPINQLLRENRKLRHDLEQWMKQVPRSDEPSPFLEALGQTISEVSNKVSEIAERRDKEDGEARKIIEEIRDRVQTLRLENKRVSRRANPQGESARVGVFVDVQNIFYGAREFDSRLDFEKLLQVAVGKRRLVRAIAYVVQSPEADQSGFVSMLQQKNYEVKRKELRLRSDGSAKGDWDMGMAIDIIGLSDKLDVVVLVSGDGDFVSLVNLVKTMGPRVEVFSFLHNTARDLALAADSYHPINEELLLKA